MISIQAHVVTFVLTLAKHGAGASMVRAMIDLIRWLYQNGGDFTRMSTEFFEPAIALITNTKTSSQVRFVMIQMTGKIFKTLWMRCANPPTKELYEAYTSLKQKHHEKYIREAAYKALKDVIKVNPSNLFQIQNDLLKGFELLAEHGADLTKPQPACQGRTGSSPAHAAFILGRRSFLKVLLQYGHSVSPDEVPRLQQLRRELLQIAQDPPKDLTLYEVKHGVQRLVTEPVEVAKFMERMTILPKDPAQTKKPSTAQSQQRRHRQ